ncbi:MAG TPA: alpha/beta fold hydrolase [Pyrinomonadaceae bacterium]|nr:alpha/beta fold hydrolase [Pyrinomonadaceae bacterium]
MSSQTTSSRIDNTPWLACPKPNPRAGLRLFCFPYAGGTATIFHQWQSDLPPSVEVCPVQLPGRGKRMQEKPFTDLFSLVEATATALRPFLDKPFAFFGHSMGGLISFELARHLRRERAPAPTRLFISGRRAPQVESESAPTHDLPESEFVEEVRKLAGTPAEVLEHPELRHLMLPLLRADFSVCETYRYTAEPPLDCPISVFGGLYDRDVQRKHLEPWGGQTTRPVTVRMLPGDHFFINTQQPLLMRVLGQELHQLASFVS